MIHTCETGAKIRNARPAEAGSSVAPAPQAEDVIRTYVIPDTLEYYMGCSTSWSLGSIQNTV